MPDNPFYPFLHHAQLANAVTSFATLLAGIMPLVLTWMTRPQPRQWMFVYWCIVITAIPTIGFHSFEDSRLWAATDTGSNILLAWALQLAVTADFSQPKNRKKLLAVTTPFSAAAIGWMYYEALSGNKTPWLVLGKAVNFYAGELALILNSIVVAAVFLIHLRAVPRHARALLMLVLGMFVVGLFLAGPANDQVGFRIVSWHALWHIWGAMAFMALWVFNLVRYHVPERVSGAA